MATPSFGQQIFGGLFDTPTLFENRWGGYHRVLHIFSPDLLKICDFGRNCRPQKGKKQPKIVFLPSLQKIPQSQQKSHFSPKSSWGTLRHHISWKKIGWGSHRTLSTIYIEICEILGPQNAQMMVFGRFFRQD